jgi:hypothetical protein
MDPLEPSHREFIDRQIKQYLETGNRQGFANILDDEAVIKRLEAALYSEAIARKALDVLCDAIEGNRISSNTVLLRTVVTLLSLSSTLVGLDEHLRGRGLHLGAKKPGRPRRRRLPPDRGAATGRRRRPQRTGSNV